MSGVVRTPPLAAHHPARADRPPAKDFGLSPQSSSAPPCRLDLVVTEAGSHLMLNSEPSISPRHVCLGGCFISLVCHRPYQSRASASRWFGAEPACKEVAKTNQNTALINPRTFSSNGPQCLSDQKEKHSRENIVVGLLGRDGRDICHLAEYMSRTIQYS